WRSRARCGRSGARASSGTDRPSDSGTRTSGWGRTRTPSPKGRSSSSRAPASTGVRDSPGMGRRVAIVGAALSDCGRVDDKSSFELHHQAASRALVDAGLEKGDVDGFASSGTGLLMPVEVAEYLGLRPTWVDGTGVGGSTWEFMVEHAMAAIAEGHVEV